MPPHFKMLHAVNKASNLKLGALVGHYQQDVWRLDGACGCRDDNQRWEEHCAASSVEDTKSIDHCQ